jgi:uncharacterized membrane protein
MGGSEYMETEKRVTGIMPFSHLPFILGITIGRLLRWNPFFTFYLGRVLSGLLYLFVVCYAIRITPMGKEIFAGIALLPMCMMHAVSYSQDGMAMIACVGFLANLLRLRYADLSEKQERNALLQTCLFAFFVGGVKGGVYLLTMPLILMLVSSKKGIRKALLIAGTGVFSFGLFEGILILTGGNVGSQLNMRTLPNLSAFYAVEHPVRYLTKVINTYLESTDLYFGQAGGSQLAWSEPVIPGFCIACMFFCICLWIFHNPMQNKPDLPAKWAVGLSLAAGIVMIPAATLIDTGISELTIYGIQGRYYIPFLPLIFLLIGWGMEYRRDLKTVATDSQETEGVSMIPAGSGTFFLVLEVYAILSVILLHFSR